MALFQPARKLADQTAQRLISGYLALPAFWALKHAGVLDAMSATPEGIEPHAHAAHTNMAPDVLAALLEYLVSQDILERREDHFLLAPAGHALLDHGDGVLEHIRAHQGVLTTLEHLLARLKTYGHGVVRKNDALVAGQAKRLAPELYPALEKILGKLHAQCLLDLNCGAGDLLVHLALASKRTVGVGAGSDGPLVHQANELIAKYTLEKRLIAVPASPLEILSEPRRTFDRIGISPQLWEKFDAVLAVNLLTDLLAVSREEATTALARFAANFPGAALIVVEPSAGPRLAKNYYAPEFALLQALTRTPARTEEQWMELLSLAGLRPAVTATLTTDALTIFTCPPTKRRG